ncbi:MAG TPA: ROK family protein [Candidatus Saccharimonadales bacterium]|nr:ROK family protein [Candidatus Saccharimonadales bacterium]
MYLGIDIGGTKTLVASINNEGVITQRHKFRTPKHYSEFLAELMTALEELEHKEFIAAGVAAPGKIDRERGVVIAFGNLAWTNIPIRHDLEKIIHCPVVVENDAKLAGLSEAMLIKEFRKVLYVTVSTGIGTGLIVDQQIEPNMADSEGGQILLEHGGKLEPWEDFASGRAIVRRFGKKASEIEDKKTWQIIAHNIAIGLIDQIALMQPDAIVLGGGVGSHYDKFGAFLREYLAEYQNPLFTVPIIKQAERPALAVLYGCYDIARQRYGKAT